MIIEYMTMPVDALNHTSEGYRNSSNRKAITMYINPSRLQFSNQKVVSESITRGGIFYHHWGDKHTVLSISGDLGLSSMAGVKKLDEVYRMSGVLLQYGENTQGPVYYDADTDFMNKIATGDYTGALIDIVSGKVSLKDAFGAAKTHAIGGALQGLGITSRNNNGLQSSKISQTIAGGIAKTMGKLKNTLNNNVNDNSIVSPESNSNDSDKNKINLSKIANAYLNKEVNKLGEKIGNSIYGKNTSGALDYLDDNIVTFEDTYGGFSDIIDELEDPWRPRLIFIYFEDHVYIGHFQSFNYTRDAASVNIHYEMSFVIQREVIITSFKPQLPGFLASRGGILA